MAQDMEQCHTRENIDPSKSPVGSAIMFAAGLFGNVLALAILVYRRCRSGRGGSARRRRSLFNVLITSLVVTDLAGTCLVSPLVQVSYARNATLVAMLPGTHGPCRYFGFTMTFFSLATLSLLFTMALERCFAIGYPYLYNRYVTRKCAYVAIPLVSALCLLFCLLPFAGFGSYVQYCPGTWCFIDMNPTGREDRAYVNLYATVMLTLVLATVACNGFVVYQLFRMYRRRKRNGSVAAPLPAGGAANGRHGGERKAVSMAEEVEHLVLLVFMTIIFIICTLPLVVSEKKAAKVSCLVAPPAPFFFPLSLRGVAQIGPPSPPKVWIGVISFYYGCLNTPRREYEYSSTRVLKSPITHS